MCNPCKEGDHHAQRHPAGPQDKGRAGLRCQRSWPFQGIHHIYHILHNLFVDIFISCTYFLFLCVYRQDQNVTATLNVKNECCDLITDWAPDSHLWSRTSPDLA